MVGKLNLDLGEDYAFDIRRARAVAEGAAVRRPGFSLPIGGVDGPNLSSNGQDYWLQRDGTDKWWIWFDIDAEPDPDVRQLLNTLLSNTSVNINYRADVRGRAEELGWQS